MVPLVHSTAWRSSAQRALGDGWRKLVADGVTATPVDAPPRRRGQGRRRRRAPRPCRAPTWPDAPRRAARRRANVHLLAPDGDVHARRTKKGRWLVSHAQAVVAGGRRASSTTARRSIRCRPTIRSSRATKISRDKERQVQHYVELLRPLPLWERERIRVVDAGCGKAYMSLALVAYGREVGTRVELVGLDSNAVGDRDRARRSPTSSATTRRGSRRRRSTTTRATSRSTCSSRCTRATPRPTRRSPPACGSAPRRSSSRRAATTSSRRRSRRTRRTACSGTGCCSDARPTSSPTRCAPPRSRSLGYRVDVIEFVSAEHTAKNVMLRAERAPSASRAGARAAEYVELRDRFGVEPAIERLLPVSPVA